MRAASSATALLRSPLVRRRLAALAGLVCVAAAVDGLAAPHPLTPIRLQQLIDTAPAGGVLDLAPGWYVGPVRIDRPLTLRGGEGVILDGRGEGTVITVAADDVAVVGLAIRRSGGRADGVDAAIRVLGARARIEGDVIDDCLYGIDVRAAADVVVRANRITGREGPEQLRGDAIRVWYASGGLYERNEISGVRDGFFLQATGNRVIGNTVRDGRYGMLLLYASGIEIADNDLLDDAVGLMLIWSDEIEIARNRVRAGRDVAGQALVMKESSGDRIVGNTFFSSAQGVFLDASPKVPENENVFVGNTFSFDGTAVTFHSGLAGDRFEGNVFTGNHTDLVVRGGGTALGSVWRGNTWDAFEGFDRDADGVGDTPHEIWSWADRLWMDVPDAQLFRGAPALAALDFVERLAPFTQPRLLMRDEAPRLSGSAPALPRFPNRDRSR